MAAGLLLAGCAEDRAAAPDLTVEMSPAAALKAAMQDATAFLVFDLNGREPPARSCGPFRVEKESPAGQVVRKMYEEGISTIENDPTPDRRYFRLEYPLTIACIDSDGKPIAGSTIEFMDWGTRAICRHNRMSYAKDSFSISTRAVSDAVQADTSVLLSDLRFP